MDRRTFLKTAGIITTATLLPARLLKAAPKQLQWIDITKQSPKLRQKFIMVYGINGITKERYLSLGQVFHSKKNKDGTGTIEFAEEEANFCINSTKPISISVKDKDKIIKTISQWFNIKNRPIIFDPFLFLKITDDDKKPDQYHFVKVYWLPVDGEYPTTLPPFPERNI